MNWGSQSDIVAPEEDYQSCEKVDKTRAVVEGHSGQQRWPNQLLAELGDSFQTERDRCSVQISKGGMGLSVSFSCTSIATDTIPYIELGHDQKYVKHF